MNRKISTIDDEAMRVLMQYDWPGNVRQLMATVENMVLVCEQVALASKHIPPELRSASSGETQAPNLDALVGLSLEQIEKQAIRNALHIYRGNREQAAKMLGIGERTLYRKLKEYGLK